MSSIVAGSSGPHRKRPLERCLGLAVVVVGGLMTSAVVGWFTLFALFVGAFYLAVALILGPIGLGALMVRSGRHAVHDVDEEWLQVCGWTLIGATGLVTLAIVLIGLAP